MSGGSLGVVSVSVFTLIGFCCDVTRVGVCIGRPSLSIDSPGTPPLRGLLSIVHLPTLLIAIDDTVDGVAGERTTKKSSSFS